MPTTPTASHAYNLFSLTMESRYGAAWRTSVEPEIIIALAHEVVTGFGGQEAEKDAADTVLWQFPDGSRARTGHFGLRRADAPAEAFA